MKCYAVIDTNVLVSALISSHNDAATVKVVEKIFSEDIIPLYSEEIIAVRRGSSDKPEQPLLFECFANINNQPKNVRPQMAPK